MPQVLEEVQDKLKISAPLFLPRWHVRFTTAYPVSFCGRYGRGARCADGFAFVRLYIVGFQHPASGMRDVTVLVAPYYQFRFGACGFWTFSTRISTPIFAILFAFRNKISRWL
jgi:hypothetical protein